MSPTKSPKNPDSWQEELNRRRKKYWRDFFKKYSKAVGKNERELRASVADDWVLLPHEQKKNRSILYENADFSEYAKEGSGIFENIEEGNDIFISNNQEDAEVASNTEEYLEESSVDLRNDESDEEKNVNDSDKEKLHDDSDEDSFLDIVFKLYKLERSQDQQEVSSTESRLRK